MSNRGGKIAPEFYQLEPIGIWKNRSASGALHILTHPDFVQIKLVEYYKALAENFDRRFENIEYICQYLPLFHDGPRHKELRKMAATHLRDRPDALQVFEDEAVQIITTKLRQAGALDVISDIVIPVMQKAALAITGLDYFPGLIAILSGNNSLRATKKLDETFGKIYDTALARFPEESEDTRAMRIVYAALGSEPLGSTLALSFEQMFSGVHDMKICDLNWTPNFPATGPDTAFRQCKHAPIDLAENAKSVKHIEVDFKPFLDDEGANHNHMFGVGAHACLGRGLSLSLWQRVVDDMKINPFKVRHMGSAEGTHKIFKYPSSICIEVIA